jgi:replicative DNA helicase
MAKIEKDTLEFLGFDYQYKLLAQLLTDKRFANSIIDIIDANYFKDEHLKIITAAIKDAKEEYDIIPDYSSIEFRMLDNITNPQTRKYVLGQLKRIKETSLNDTLKVQEVAMKFCKTQELKKSIKQIAAIIDKGDTDEYEKCESILRKALEHGDSKDDGMDVLHDLESVLDEDFRKPIPTGIKGLDEIMDGGLSKGELAVILAPFGVGKSQPLTSNILTPNGWVTMGNF